MNKKMMKIAALASAVCLIASGCGSAKSNDETKLKKVSVSKLEKKDFSETLDMEGIVESSEKDSTVTTELTQYKVSSVNVSVGDRVKAGDVLCELDSSELQQQITDLEKIVNDSDTLYDYRYEQLKKQLESTKKSTELDVNEASKKLDELRSEYNNKKSEYESGQNDYNRLKGEADDLRSRAAGASDEAEAAMLMSEYQAKIGEASEAMARYESAYAQMKSINESIPMAEKALESAKIMASDSVDKVQYEIDTYSLTADSSSENIKKLDELKKQLDKTVVKAERDGVVSSVLAEEGKICREGILMTLQNTSDMCIHISVSEEDLLSVEAGMKTVITIPARKDDEYTGKVDRILDIKTGEGFDGYITIDDTENFRIGMKANVKIKTVDAEDVIGVNKKAVFSDEDSDKKYVFEAEKQDENSYKLRKVEVTEGISGDQFTEISGEGLEEGDYIVLTPGKCEADEIVNVRVSR